jgi:branched-chain amino acid aminotransferase
MSDYSNGSAFVDEEFVPISEAKISILDWGFLHSDATYDVAHVRGGKFFRLNDHLDRFYSGMKMLRMSIPYNRNELAAILSDCVSKSGLQDAYVEMITTRGLPEPGSRDPRTCRNRFYAFAIPFVWITTAGKGLDLIVSQRQRIPPQSVDPTVKNYHWLDLVMGQFEAYDKGGETVAVVNGKGNIAEGPGFNIFSVKNKILTTPREGVLEGITRKTAIELASELGYDVIQDELSPEAARSADELFATSTAGGIMAITKIDCLKVSTGEVGPITLELQNRYWALHDNPRYACEIQY